MQLRVVVGQLRVGVGGLSCTYMYIYTLLHVGFMSQMCTKNSSRIRRQSPKLSYSYSLSWTCDLLYIEFPQLQLAL